MRRYSTTSLPVLSTAALTLSPFPMWPAFPTSKYYGDSATIWCPQLALCLPAARPDAEREGQPQIASHVH
ncbi:MAG: hypothetical protein QOH09_853 [Pseudonocardiales bacterium]|jgi:hypothetical protein|nr:hypothetical protein [Pseudonocardiales bacterium]